MQNKVANEEAAIAKKAAGEERRDKAAAVAERGEPTGLRWAAETVAQKATIPMLKPVVQLFNRGRLPVG
eukprot:553249-Rhodomonas_salina.1